MTKKELKDIILKTLEKEGGAAGIKALAKAAKTSKNKLKKDLDDMSGVKQHQDGDYISTPINEEETDTPPQAPSFCHYCYKQDCFCHSGNGCVNAGSLSQCGQDPPDFTPTGVSGDLFDPSGNYVRPTLYKRPTKKLREVKDIIEVMLDEKKKKKNDRCHRKADSVYGTKTSAYKSGAIVKCRKGMIWKVGGKKKK